MTMTNLSVAIALSEDPVPENTALVTSMLAKPRRTSGTHSGTEDTDLFLSYGSLLVAQYDLEATVTQQLYPFTWLLTSRALYQATQDIRTSGAPVISVFASTAWRLLIASKITSLPSAVGGESFVSGPPENLIVLMAKLFAQPAPSKASSSRAISVWRAMVPAADDEAISSFLSMAMQLSRRTSIERSKAFH
jgi:hypothetical protein